MLLAEVWGAGAEAGGCSGLVELLAFACTAQPPGNGSSFPPPPPYSATDRVGDGRGLSTAACRFLPCASVSPGAGSGLRPLGNCPPVSPLVAAQPHHLHRSNTQLPWYLWLALPDSVHQ